MNIIMLCFFQGKISPKTENDEEQEEVEEDDDGDKKPGQSKTPVFSFPSSSLGDIPVVCKTEEVHTEFIEEVRVVLASVLSYITGGSFFCIATILSLFCLYLFMYIYGEKSQD